MPSTRTCTVADCTRKFYAKGLCKMHYQRQRMHGTTDPIIGITDSDRMHLYVDKNGPGGCWIWTGNEFDRGGYGRLKVNGKHLHAHVWSYQLAGGSIPEGMELDHLCHTQAVAERRCPGGDACIHRRCVNPAHLQPVTVVVNQERGVNALANRDVCLHGHALTPDNIYRRPGGQRAGKGACLTCKREAWHRWKARKGATA